MMPVNVDWAVIVKIQPMAIIRLLVNESKTKQKVHEDI